MSTREVPYAFAYPGPYSHLPFVFASPSPHTVESALVTQFDVTLLPPPPPLLPLPPPLPKQPWPTLTRPCA
jgi:hypothetical protein